MYTIKRIKVKGKKRHYVFCGGKHIGTTYIYRHDTKKRWSGWVFVSSKTGLQEKLGIYRSRGKAARAIYEAALSNNLITPLDMLTERLKNV